MSDTVTGKAAWDALGEGKAIRDEYRGVRTYQIDNGLLVRRTRAGMVDASTCTVDSILYGKWEIRPRIGDAPVWKDSE